MLLAHATIGGGQNGDTLRARASPGIVRDIAARRLKQRQQENAERIPETTGRANKPPPRGGGGGRHFSNATSNNPYEGWQPLPPQLPSGVKCSWRQCLDPTGQSAKCTPYCRESDQDMQPLPIAMPGSWIPDVEITRRMFLKGVDGNGNAFPPPLDDELCEPMGPFGQKNDINKDMIDAVNVQIMDDDGAVSQPTRILCMVYTMADAHAGRIRAMRETWAGRCDGFLAFSTESDPRIPAISLPHEGAEAYGNMWQKVRSIWRFVGEHYADEFDYFFLGGDDLFVIPENLRSYLSTLESSDEDHFVGRRFKGYGQSNYFNSGGAGYALSRGLLKRYYSVLDDKGCAPHATTSMEDVNTAACLRNVLGVGLTDTRDAQGRERFHPFAPGTHYTYKPTHDKNMGWYEDYNKEWGIKLGADCCAPDSVSFHYIKKAPMVRHIYKLLYDGCPRGTGRRY